MEFGKNQRQTSPTSAKPVKPRKFRSSCDSCSTSKVKCGQEQPQCTRCVTLGICCNYSPSRRMGKPPASGRQLPKSSNISSSDAERQNSPKPAKKRQRSPSSELNLPVPTIEPIQCDFDPSLLNTDDFMSMVWQDDIFHAPAFETSSTADMPLTTSNLFDFNFTFTGDPNQLTSNNQFNFGDDSSLDSRRASSRDPVDEPSQLFTPNSSISPKSTTRVSPRSRLSTPSLCTHQVEFGRPPSPTPIFESATSIDQVLITNKAEIENAYALLACDCSYNPHFALTLALICNKILAMYEAVIELSPASSKSSPSGCGGSISITVGAYKMDAEDEERMRIQIVVNELRKVKGLVDRYASKYCTSDVGDGEGIYTALVSFLRSKFATTLQDLLTRLE